MHDIAFKWYLGPGRAEHAKRTHCHTMPPDRRWSGRAVMRGGDEIVAHSRGITAEHMIYL